MELEKEKTLISIVSPVYRAEKIVDELVRRIVESVSTITDDFEIILVEDGSPDNSWEAIERNCALDKRVKGIKLSRNFGQHAAITAGLQTSSGQWIVVMDCDLQDKPEEIPNLFQKAAEGFDVVFASRSIRIDSYFKKFFSRLFYKSLSYLTNTSQNPEIANFGIYKSKVIHSVLSMGDYIRFFPTMVKWVGFKHIAIDVEHSSRFEGESTYNFRSLIRLGIDTILSFSEKPLRIVLKTGIFISIISFMFAIYYFIRALLGTIDVAGYSSLIISTWLLSGIIITLIGGVGLYIGKTFEQVKNRPVYLLDKTHNLHDEKHN